VVHHSKPSGPPFTLAWGIAEIRAQVPFRVRVINPTDQVQILPKGMVIGLAEPHPSRVITVNGFEGVNAVSAGDAVVHDERDVNSGRPESHSGVDIFAEREEGTRTQEQDKKPMSGQRCTWKEEVDLAHLPADEREEVLRMLEPHR
jgi:hypothetical protein